jgi:hypothetical protein
MLFIGIIRIRSYRVYHTCVGILLLPSFALRRNIAGAVILPTAVQSVSALILRKIHIVHMLREPKLKAAAFFFAGKPTIILFELFLRWRPPLITTSGTYPRKDRNYCNEA